MRHRAAPDPTTSPFISVIVPVHNGAMVLPRALAALAQTTYPYFECLVVDDGSTDETRAVANRFETTVLTMAAGPLGPAAARNRGAAAASGEILFFVDADVLVQPETLAQVAALFAAAPDVAALFGSYDESPHATDFTSQYKNLAHCFVHQQARTEAQTFWSGCGAIRREVFMAMGGFDAARYPRPSIEDIELGYRLSAAGHRILLAKEIQVKHLKQWTLQGLIKCDIFDRAIPWTLLNLSARAIPDDLNLRRSQRVSAMLLCLVLLVVVLASPSTSAGALLLLLGLFLAVVSGWQWASGVDRRSRGAMAGLVGAGGLGGLAVGALAWGGPWLVAAAPVLLGLVALPWRRERDPVWSQHFFVATVTGSVVSLLVLLFQLPGWMAVLVGGLLLLIVLLNRDFYTFFARRRGVAFAVAVFPFHLLYYLYSVVSFAVGIGVHLWQGPLRRLPNEYSPPHVSSS